MSFNFKNLNVASLDYSDIVLSLRNFFKQEPSLKDFDWDNDASAVNMFISILATATAYNGVYSQFGYRESFLSTANILASIVGHASNSSILLEVKKSAKSTRNISVGASGLESYTAFPAVTPDGTETFFYNLESFSADTSGEVNLYCGTQILQETDWDFNSQSMILPLTIDPETIKLYSVSNVGDLVEWTRVTKSEPSVSGGQYYFTVLNTTNGYLVTTNLPESFVLTTDYTVYSKAVISNGSIGNSSTISSISGVTFLTSSLPSGGYEDISVDYAKSKVKFLATSQNRCVTIQDYILAIQNSGISGTDDVDLITVQPGDQTGVIKIYVENLSESSSNELMAYLGNLAVAGINLIYQQ
jgi:hypothetical protein